MGQPAGANKVWKKRDHIAVLAGDKQVGDMVVFLMYRKLKALLNADPPQEPAAKPKEKVNV